MSEIVEPLSAGLIHFLWQGCAIALANLEIVEEQRLGPVVPALTEIRIAEEVLALQRSRVIGAESDFVTCQGPGKQLCRLLEATLGPQHSG